MLDGHMLHRDHLGNQGDLRSGGAQWMTAGRGIIHSEMPQQESGRMRGFQLWINLPASEKMKPAGYRDIQPDEIPELMLANGGKIRVIAGTAEIDHQAEHHRVVQGPIHGISTEPLFLDVRLPANATFSNPVAQGHNAFIYPYEGNVGIGPNSTKRSIGPQTVGVLSAGDNIEVESGAEPAAFLVLAAKPLLEPVLQYGPFVMNTREQIEQAIYDYQHDQLV